MLANSRQTNLGRWSWSRRFALKTDMVPSRLVVQSMPLTSALWLTLVTALPETWLLKSGLKPWRRSNPDTLPLSKLSASSVGLKGSRLKCSIFASNLQAATSLDTRMSLTRIAPSSLALKSTDSLARSHRSVSTMESVSACENAQLAVARSQTFTVRSSELEARMFLVSGAYLRNLFRFRLMTAPEWP